MRRLGQRPLLPARLDARLSKESSAISKSPDPKSEANRRYTNARGSKWFEPVLEQLGKLAGPGRRCMLCSGSEASDVEHYRPKAVFPDLAMVWENYLWSCTVCNRAKGDRFPPDTEPGGRIVNPLDDDPWAHFFIDEFGILTPRFDPSANALDQRAVSTRDILKLNRDALQESRKSRLDDLMTRASKLLSEVKAHVKTADEARDEVKLWLVQPFQSDVADYFLRGPGKAELPFKSLFEAIDT